MGRRMFDHGGINGGLHSPILLPHTGVRVMLKSLDQVAGVIKSNGCLGWWSMAPS